MHIVRPKVYIKRFTLLGGPVDERDGYVNKSAGNLGTLHPAHPFAKPLGVSPDSSRLGRILPRFES